MPHPFGRLSPDASVIQHTQRIFDIYNLFRLLLSLILLISIELAAGESVLGAFDPDLYRRTSQFYVLANIIIFLRGFLWRSHPLDHRHYVAIIILDLLVLAMISYTCGGMASGMTSLLIIPVAAGSVLIPGILSLFLAAVGSIAVIYVEVYLHLSLGGINTYYVQAGLLGMILFATATIIQVLSRRLRQNEMLAARQSARIQYLLELNEQVIQRMNTGLVVVDGDDAILISNHAARRLMNFNDSNQYPLVLPDPLLRQLRQWRDNPYSHSPPFRLDEDSPRVQAGFSWLKPEERSLALIFLEDFSTVNSRVQQLKLVSLGRLTASIAHEIRNPLGAISHASQLLSESGAIEESDRRLTDIILSHSRRISTIINNILELSRNRSTMPERIDLGPWLQDFVNTFHDASATRADIRVEPWDDGLAIRFNESQLRQLLTNLCENSLRYGQSHEGAPHVLIRASLDPVSAAAQLDIIDNGPGVSQTDQERIFEPFFTTGKQGTGLGLYICREICEANQARLSYHQSESGGSCFRINFVHPDKYATS